MTALDTQADWIDRFVTQLSRLQLDISSELRVDMALARWATLRQLPPEEAVRVEVDAWPVMSPRT